MASTGHWRKLDPVSSRGGRRRRVDQADEFTVFIYDGYGTQALFGHEEEGILDDAVFADDRVVLPFMHDIVDGEQQFFAKGTAGMEDTELFFS